MAYKAPGVYVEEITTLAPSVVAVETAIPAFIGYTETAIDDGGNNLRFVPTRIKSLLEYQRFFGGDFVPATYQVVLDTAGGNAVGAVSPRNAANTERRYRLFNSVRHYYANGGGPCYIVSVGSYADAPAVGTATTGLLGGLAVVAPVDDPTLLVFPDGVSLSAAAMGSLQVAALAQCELLQDRFVIMDLVQGDQPISLALNPIQNFRDNVGTNSLKYGAAYYPWVRTIYEPDVHFRQLALVTPANAAIPNAVIDSLTGDPVLDALPATVRAADTTVTSVVNAVDLTAMTNPGAITLTRANFAQLSSHFDGLVDRLRQLPAAAPDADVRQRFNNLIVLPRELALALRTLDPNPPTLPTPLVLAIADLRGNTDLRGTISGLVAYEKNAGVMSAIAAARTVGDVATDYTSLNATDWIAPNANVGAIAASGDVFTGANLRETALNAASALRRFFDPLTAAMLSLFSAAEFLAGEAENQLFARHPVFAAIASQVTRAMVMLPPSGAVAGVYAAVDRTRGVWKAPANVSLADLSGVAVKVNDQMQEGLNVTTTGKSVNAIRAFAGKGSLVWGARTLAGNDNEWRYVPVRRFFNMAEESIKKASEPFVFEPNDRGTWVRVRAMIENFLTVQWRQGALVGKVPAQAFFVKVGLGETMTSQDILEGRMIVEVGMAVVRPAEFIILRFAHKMQTS
jgi:phage tail sheath protein FI